MRQGRHGGQIIRILYITTDENRHLGSPDRAQGDCIENGMLIGLRKLLKHDCVEYPRKKILYGDFSSVKKSALHGAGFSIYHEPMEDIPPEHRDLADKKFDVILYGTAYAWGMQDIPALEKKCKLKFYIDGHDLYGTATRGKYIYYRGEKLIGNQVTPAFKGQIIQEEPDLYPIGVGIPESRILPIDLSKKCQLIQKAYPRFANFEPVQEENRQHHIFTDEEMYYEDMAKSWFGLSCKRGGFDAIRHYEIIAAGAVLLYRDYDKKPRLCSPVDLPTIGYSSPEELKSVMNRLLKDGVPTDEYLNLLNEQRQWLIETATTEARAKYIVKILESYVNKN